MKKKLLVKWFFNILKTEKKNERIHVSYTCLLLFLLTLFSQSATLSQDTRNGAIDLTGGQGRYFNCYSGSGDHPLGSSEFTIEMWIKIVDNDADDMCLWNMKSDDNRVSFVYKDDTHFRLEVDGAATNGDGDIGEWYWDFDAFSSSVVFLNNWVHVAFRYNGGSYVAFYINGSFADGGNLYKGEVTTDKKIIHIMPQEGNGGYLEIGGTSDRGTKGKAYVADVRIFDEYISSTYISRYYEEEINSNHPNWNDLIRYYTGNKEYVDDLGDNLADNDVVYIDDVMNNYNGVLSDDDVRVGNYYPPIHPPRLDDWSFGFYAQDCQSDGTIYTDWSEPSGYTPGNNVDFAIKRGSTYLTHRSSSYYSDSDLGAGEKETYYLYTYWEINGVKYYSTDYESDDGSNKTEYDAPSNSSASDDNCDASIDISWDWSGTNPPGWRIKRYNQNKSFLANIDISDGSTRSYNDPNLTIEQDYYYKIEVYGNDDNGCAAYATQTGYLQGFTSEPPAEPTSLTINEDHDNSQLEIDWTNPSGNNADSWIIKRTWSDGSNEVDLTEDLANTFYDDSDIDNCRTFLYTVGAVNECAENGVFSSTELSGKVNNDLSEIIDDVEASKGYYSNSVRIEWEVDAGMSLVDRFKIYRSLADEDNYQLVSVVDNDLIFDDETALGGLFYNYKIVGESECEDETYETNYLEDLGFVIPFGVANGHVEYDGGNAVEDVEVTFEKQDGQTGQSVYFDGNGDYIEVSGLVGFDPGEDLTVEFWMKPEDTNSDAIIFELWGSYLFNFNFFLQNGEIGFVIGTTTTYYVQTPVTQDVYQHVTGTYNGDSVSLYIDGEFKASVAATGTLQSAGSSLYIGGDPNYDYYKGWLDEIRIFNRAKTSEEIEFDYKRILNNSEDSLIAYWRCDEGVGDHIYDASKDGIYFNKNDGEFNGNVSFSEDIPTDNQLGIVGKTNSYGDYTVDYIPYVAGGEILKVTPLFGQHQFQPSNRSIYVGDGAQTHNGLDFTDISSFEISGKVTYYNSEYPVEGVAILVDGKNAVGTDNQPVRTDENGDYTIEVPIGFHYISVEKDGHIFSDGYFPPLNQYGDIETWEFVDDLYPVNFVDSTFITVAGRVVGGEIEGDKNLGFRYSTNNVGQFDVTFDIQSSSYYDLEVDNPSVDDFYTITTDDSTGEYFIHLIPETWDVSYSYIGSSGYSIPGTFVLDLSQSLDLQIYYDSVQYIAAINDEDTTFAYDVDTVQYHHALNYVLRNTPEVEVLNADGTDFSGDDELTFSDQETGVDTTLDLSGLGYFSFPVFQMGKTYDAYVHVFENYVNADHPLGPVDDKVPVNEAALFITNNLMVNPSTLNESTDEDGLFLHQFRAGVPSLSTDNNGTSYTQTFEVNVTVGSTNITWRDGDIYRGYVFGAQPLAGTDFITYGPEVPDIILRDPPGSHSYAYIEQGSSYTSNQRWKYEMSVNTELDWTLYQGMKAEFGGGLLGPVTTVENTMNSEYGMELIKEFNQEGSYLETTTFTERIETSSEDNAVGSMADMYIGSGYNFFMTKTMNLKLMKKSYCIATGLDYLDLPGSTNDDYVPGIIDGFAADGSTKTNFIYSQSHILNYLIPDMMELRDNLFQQYPQNYQSNLPYTNRYYGMSNDDSDLAQYKLDSITQNPSLDTVNFSYIFTPDDNITIDSVDALNQQIGIWLAAIALNEAEKAEADQLIQNLSIDGASGAYTSEIEEVHNSSYTYKRVNKIKAYANAKAGLTLNGAGFSLESNFDAGFGIKTDYEKENSNRVKFGYVIDERDQGDYYSIDVLSKDGVDVFDQSSFSDWLPDKAGWTTNQINGMVGYKVWEGDGVGLIGGAKMAVGLALTKLVAKGSARKNAYVNVGLFAVDLGYQIYDLVNLIMFRESIHNQMDDNGSFDLSGFAISSPVFSIRGGQSKCPYEGEEYTSFYVDDNEDSVKLHTATLQREVPVIGIEPAILTNVPDNSAASFTLKLENHSESNTGMWYEIIFLDNSNDDGLSLRIDGNSPERSYYVPAWEIVEKTLTVTKTRADVFEYDSVGLILKSICQYDPVDDIDDIADTVFFSVHFLPTCSDVDLKNMQDNWVVNYNDNDQMTLTLTEYDVNLTTLKTLEFQYKELSGTPVTAITYFQNDDQEYQDFTFPKELINGVGEINYTWDISNLTDQQYQIRAKSTCTDGSTFESPYYLGLFDRKPPKVFGNPEPADGILSPGENISIQFDETIQEGLFNDAKIKITGVLNGTEISHNASVGFDGVNDYAAIADGLLLNDKSFTIEFWLRRNAAGEALIVSQGQNTAEDLQIWFNSNDELVFDIGTYSLSVDPTNFYNSSAFPWNGWHHYGFVYDYDNGIAFINIDDEIVAEESNVSIDYLESGKIFLGKSSSSSSGCLNGNIHEFRIWNKAQTLGELASQMSIKLSGNEIGLYRLWEMNEGRGNILADKARRHQMELFAPWAIEPDGFAVALNGTDQYVEADMTQVVIDDETDMTIEFWFKGDLPQSEVTLFSNGKGDGNEGYPEQDPRYFMSISGQTNGSLVVNSKGFSFTAVSTNVFDNDWHHFALVLDRNGNTRAYLDAELQSQTQSSSMGQFAGPDLWLGARGWKADASTKSFDNYFIGYIDEVRIWNTARTATQIELYVNAKLNGDESGLLLYYPFEAYVNILGILDLQESWDDQRMDPYGSTTVYTADAVNLPTLGLEAPEIKDARPVQEVAFDWVINDDEIIITPTTATSKIENVILEISVKDVFDLNGNKLLSPASWTAYIDQNQVVWSDDGVNLEKVLYDPLSFKASIKNLGGVPYDFEISNLPDWLTPTIEQGSIQPNTELEVTFTINEALNTGIYDETIYLTTSYGFDEKFDVSLRVYKEMPASWAINTTDFRYSMSVIGIVSIDNIISTDKYDVVGAFVDDQCRGLAYLEYYPAYDVYLAFIDIYSNLDGDEDVKLRIWDASAGKVFTNVSPAISFNSDQILGAANNPVSIETTDYIEQDIDLAGGWQWISFNLSTPDLISVDAMLSTVSATEDDQVKSQTRSFDSYHNGLWQGFLTDNGGFNNTEMFMIHTDMPSEIVYEGTIVDPESVAITIEPGWNWIGFIPQVNMPVQDALSSFNATPGDVVKGQYSFAMYDQNMGWLGSLDFMKPGQGYKYSSLNNTNEILQYPAQSVFKSTKKEETIVEISSDACNLKAENYAGNMSLVAQLNTGNKISGDSYMIAAFAGDECVALNASTDDDLNADGMYFITIFGEAEQDLNFKLLSQNGESWDINEKLAFGTDKVTGSIASPFLFTIEGYEANSSSVFAQQELERIKLYPNPFNGSFVVDFRAYSGDDIESVKIVNMLGQVVDVFGRSISSKGILQYNASHLRKGIYFIQIKTQKGVITKQMMKE